MTAEQARQLCAQMVRPKRFHHCACVAKAAVELAPLFGADAEQAEIAGWLHDVMKHQPDSVLLKTMAGSAIMSDKQLMRKKKLWHAWAGGIYVRETLGLPQELASAVFYHTTGRADMTPLEKTVFLADYISEDRVGEDAEAVRRLAGENGDAACLLALQQTISRLTKAGRFLELTTVEAYNWLVCQLDARDTQ